MKLHKGDIVFVTKGRDAGKTGEVLSVARTMGRLIVAGVNMYKKNVRPRRPGEKGQTIEAARSLSVSNVMLVCTACKKPSRMGYRVEGDDKVRYCKRCSAAQTK